MMTDPKPTDPPVAAPAPGDAPVFPDPALHRLYEELRGLGWMVPGHPVPPEADEADFDNMPV